MALAIILLSFLSMYCFVVMFIAPWIGLSMINDLQAQIRTLKRQVAILSKHLVEKQNSAAPPPTEQQVETPPPLPEPKPQAQKIKPPSKPKPTISLEQRLGARLPVWIGGIAIALAGLFLVKYSFDNNLLSPTFRLSISGIAGCLLLFFAERIRLRPQIANGQRISQALAGAGLVVLYGVFYAASALYDLLPPLPSFAGMALTTALAVALSLKQGFPIALLGLLGGFITPVLLGSGDASTPLLFVYLYFVVAGLMSVIRHKGWWKLSIFTVIGAFLWIIFWITRGVTADDTIWLGLFLTAVSATIVFSLRQTYESEPLTLQSLGSARTLLPVLSLSGSLALMGAILDTSGYGLIEWSFFVILSCGGLALAIFDEVRYGFVPWTASVIAAIMISRSGVSDLQVYGGLLAGFAALYILSSYVQLRRHAKQPLLWAGLLVATALGYFLLAYYQLRDHVALDFWGYGSLALAGVMTILAQQIQTFYAKDPQYQKLLAVFIASATAFLAIGLTIILPRDFLPVTIAMQMAALAWLDTRLDIKALRPLVCLFGVVFGILLIPQLLHLLHIIFLSLFTLQLHQTGLTIVDYPLFQLGLPALLFLFSPYALSRRRDDRAVSLLEGAAIALFGIMGYYVTRSLFHYEDDTLYFKMTFMQRGIITTLMALYGVACLRIGEVFRRNSFSLGGLFLCVIAILRIVYFDLFLQNPLFDPTQIIPGIFLMNALIFAFGLPLLWGVYLRRYLQRSDHHAEMAMVLDVFLFGLAFLFISLNIRYAFQGATLFIGTASDAEIYTYSAAWGVFGIALLFFGTLKKHKQLRYASLVMMILTVAKVFLYDAAALEGLLRVFSFFGLGLSLIGLSWFYTRFIFKPSAA